MTYLQSSGSKQQADVHITCDCFGNLHKMTFSLRPPVMEKPSRS